jgi:hypothetical protein
MFVADVYEDRLDFIGVDNLDSMVMCFGKEATMPAKTAAAT